MFCRWSGNTTDILLGGHRNQYQFKNAIKSGGTFLCLYKDLCRVTYITGVKKSTRELCPYQHENGCGGVCPKCGVFHKMLQQRIKPKHTIKKTLKCEQCGASFGTKGNLKQHIEAIHLKRIINQKCEHCDNIMKTDLEYVDHLVNEHSTLKLPAFVFKKRNSIFKCPNCPDQFAHLKTYHKHGGGPAKVNTERSLDWRSQTRIQLDMPVLCPKKQ